MIPAQSVIPPGAAAPKAAAPKRDATCYVQNSKNGDIINILPILYDRFKASGSTTGQGSKQVLMVSAKYASLLSGCSYIEPVLWEGDWTDLNGAIKKANEEFKTVVSLSTFGASLKLQRQTPSFAMDQYRLAGVQEKYGQLPLVFDKRDNLREAYLMGRFVGPAEDYILFADHSESSPFGHTDDLVQLLKEQFPDHKLVRLSEVRAKQIYDLIGLYNHAAVIVSIETMHLHLTAACDTPVIALVTDRPELWHGTPWRKQFMVHCRYSDYQQRKAEIVEAVRAATGLHRGHQPEIEITGTGGYNLTSIDWQGKRIGVYRWHANPQQWRTDLAAWTGEKTVKVTAPKGFEQNSIEDGRLFVHNGKLMLSYTVARQNANGPSTAVIQYAELDTTGEPWKLVNPVQPRYPGNDFTKLEKNWSFWSSGGKLYAAYQRSPEQIVLELDGDKVVQEFRTQAPKWDWGQIRGGTFPIPHKGLWLQFFHSSTRSNKTAWGWCYYLGALLMETTPPYQIVAVSRFPILAGTERYFAVTRWKPRILFPAGAVAVGDKFVVSLGVNDAATGKLTLNWEDLNL